MSASELEREQQYVGGLYARLDTLQQEAIQQLARVRRENVGGHHQSRSERDAFARIYEDRIVQLREVNERLAFGRLELEDDEPDDDDERDERRGGDERGDDAGSDRDGSDRDGRDGDERGDDAGSDRDGRGGDEPGDDSGSVHRYIGRIGLRDDELRPLLLDWRVPQASAFYQATAARPLGTRARRHLISRGRDIVRIEDEIFDPGLLTDGGGDLQGEGALLSALTAERTGRMADIVATIQGEQDRIIRSDLQGVLVVQGGPGTGKTAVALHRAAYLLYSHRDRLRNSGVLIVGPSRSFLHYIEAVLPSLGETGVVMASVGQLFPGTDATAEDAPAVAALKGSAGMAELIARAVRSRQRVPDQSQQLDLNGDSLTLEPSVIANAIARANQSRKPYNEARVTFVKAALSELTRRWAEQLRAQGNSVDESDHPMLREDLRSAHDVRVALNTAWLPLTPHKLLQDLYARPHWLAELTPSWTAERRALLRRDRDAAFTISDVPLLDEAAELLGEYDVVNAAERREQKQQRKRDVENAERAIENMGVGGLVNAEDLAAGFADSAEKGTTAERAAADRSWTYGHIVVDEAQELSPMQWRLLRRRCPIRSFTVVGDIAQAASASAAWTWNGALRTLVGNSAEEERFRLEELTVNYRTPSQIAEVAESMAIAHGLPVTPSTAVRASEWPVRVTDDAVEAVRYDRMISTAGTLAVIAPQHSLTSILERLSAEWGTDVAAGADGLDRAIAVLTPQDAKGLEFDAVVVVDPSAIVVETERGAAALYVSMTRPTQRLTLVSTGTLPSGLEALDQRSRS